MSSGNLKMAKLQTPAKAGAYRYTAHRISTINRNWRNNQRRTIVWRLSEQPNFWRRAMDFIERIFGVSPDGGDGSLEGLWFLIPLVILAALLAKDAPRGS